MRPMINELYDKTEDVVQRIGDSTMDDLLELVALRDTVIESLQQEGLLEDGQKTLLAQIASNDDIIIARMIMLRDEANHGLEKISKSRMQKQVYESSYSNESYFFDKRE